MDAPPTWRQSTVPPMPFRPGSIWLRHLVIAGGSFAIVFLALSGVAEISFRLLSAWTVALVSTLVTGPSRTADIERVLTVGVQGPARVAVLFLDALG